MSIQSNESNSLNSFDALKAIAEDVQPPVNLLNVSFDSKERDIAADSLLRDLCLLNIFSAKYGNITTVMWKIVHVVRSFYF